MQFSCIRDYIWQLRTSYFLSSPYQHSFKTNSPTSTLPYVLTVWTSNSILKINRITTNLYMYCFESGWSDNQLCQITCWTNRRKNIGHQWVIRIKLSTICHNFQMCWSFLLAITSDNHAKFDFHLILHVQCRE